MEKSISTLTKVKNVQSAIETVPVIPAKLPLTLAEKKVYLSRYSGVMLKEKDDDQLALLAGMLMDRAKIRLNHQKDYVNDEEMLVMIAKDLKAFPGITEDEVWAAFTMGLNGDFIKDRDKDPVIYFSAANLMLWLRAYIETVKVPVMKKVAQAEQEATNKKDPSLAEQNAMLIKGLLAHYDKMKADLSYTFQDYGNAYYSFLTEIGIEIATLEEKKAMYAEELEAEKKAPVSEIKDIKHRNEWLTMVENNWARAQDDPFEFRIKSRCKRRALAKYLKECVEFDMDLAQIIHDRI